MRRKLRLKNGQSRKRTSNLLHTQDMPQITPVEEQPEPKEGMTYEQFRKCLSRHTGQPVRRE